MNFKYCCYKWTVILKIAVLLQERFFFPLTKRFLFICPLPTPFLSGLSTFQSLRGGNNEHLFHQQCSLFPVLSALFFHLLHLSSPPRVINPPRCRRSIFHPSHFFSGRLFHHWSFSSSAPSPQLLPLSYIYSSSHYTKIIGFLLFIRWWFKSRSAWLRRWEKGGHQTSIPGIDQNLLLLIISGIVINCGNA